MAFASMSAVIGWRAGLLHLGPQHAGQQRAAEAEARELGDETAAGLVDGWRHEALVRPKL